MLTSEKSIAFATHNQYKGPNLYFDRVNFNFLGENLKNRQFLNIVHTRER